VPTSIRDASIDATFAQASQRRTVTVNNTQIGKPFPSPEDWRDQWIYFLMIDRFNKPSGQPNHLPFDDAYGGFQGGTLQGVREKLGYIKNLGAGAVWITPVLQNPQWQNSPPNAPYHGYGFQNLLKVDPRFGTEQDLIDLVDEAHAHGLYVILDVVINHAGDVFEYPGHGSKAPFQTSPYDPIFWRRANGTAKPQWRVAPQDMQGDPELTEEAAVFPDELRDNRLFRRQGAPEHPDVLGDFDTLKEIATDFGQTTPQTGFEFTARNLLIRAYQYLIAKFDVDGFRVDALKHVERPFARIFGNAIREYALSIGKTNFFTFGEVADGEAKIAEYTGRFASDPDDLVGVDAALDFPLFHVLRQVAKGLDGDPPGTPSNLANLFENRKAIQHGQREQGVVISSHGEAGQFFCTFLDNHDQHSRFGFLGPNPTPFEDQVSLGIACLYSLLGIPVLYYGTEARLNGSGNAFENVREALWGKANAFDENAPFYKEVRKISGVRAATPALRYGRQYFRPVSGNGTEFGISTSVPGLVAFSRILNDTEVVVLANPFTTSTMSGSSLVDFALNPNGATFSIRYSNKSAPTGPGPCVTHSQNTVIVHQLDGSTSTGPIRALPYTLEPMEVQILAQT
jgi:glycosidase